MAGLGADQGTFVNISFIKHVQVYIYSEESTYNYLCLPMKLYKQNFPSRKNLSYDRRSAVTPHWKVQYMKPFLQACERSSVQIHYCLNTTQWAWPISG